MAQVPHQLGVDCDLYEMKHVDSPILCPIEKTYNIFRNQAYRLPELSPNYFKSVIVVKGDWTTVGSEKEVTYYPEGKSKGKTESFKDRLVGADESVKSVTYRVLEGGIMEDYTSFFAELMVTNLGGCNWTRWTVLYQKKSQCSPDPHNYLDLLGNIMAQVPHQGLEQFQMKHVDVQIQSSPDKFYNIFRNEAWRLPELSPDYIKSVIVVKGDWTTVASEKVVTYYPEGKSKCDETEFFKDKLAGSNESAKSVTFQVSEGKIMEDYKSFFAELIVTNLGGCNWARWTVVYQKKYPSSPDPHKYLDLLKKINKDVDVKLPCN